MDSTCAKGASGSLEEAWLAAVQDQTKVLGGICTVGVAPVCGSTGRVALAVLTKRNVAQPFLEDGLSRVEAVGALNLDEFDWVEWGCLRIFYDFGTASILARRDCLQDDPLSDDSLDAVELASRYCRVNGRVLVAGIARRRYRSFGNLSFGVENARYLSEVRVFSLSDWRVSMS